MTPIKHSSSNVMVRRPDDWDDRQGKLPIPALYATQGLIDGVKIMVTFWAPTKDELAMLIAGGRVQLTCLGGQPACNVSAIPPNELGSNIILPN